MTLVVNRLSERPNFRGPLQAVILDWAGTAVDFGSRAPVAAVIAAFESQGVSVSIEQARGPMGKAKRDHIRAMLEVPEVWASWDKLHQTDIETAIDQVYESFLPIQEGVLKEHSKLIPGTIDAIEVCRRRGMKIGSSTGYTRELMDILVPLAAEQGYQPDAIVCASDVSEGRPAPWMCFENARRLNVYPPQAIVKVDDTTVGIEAGHNAGMWTVGFAASGNLVGLSLEEFTNLDDQERNRVVTRAGDQLLSAGAHVVVDSIAELPKALDQIDSLINS